MCRSEGPARRGPGRRSPSSRGAGGPPRTDPASSRPRAPTGATARGAGRRRVTGGARPRHRARRSPASAPPRRVRTAARRGSATRTDRSRPGRLRPAAGGSPRWFRPSRPPTPRWMYRGRRLEESVELRRDDELRRGADAPSALSASRYCSAIVFSSTPEAAPKIRVSASLKPSARRIAACRSPSALRISACFWPSATLMAACRLPSDSVTTARRVRSAVSCRFIASWTSRGGVISRISTVVTLPPQRSVDLVELDPEHLVDLFALREDLVEEDVADDGAERRRRDALQRAREVGDVDDALERVGDPPVDQEVDVDRGVVLRDRRLARDLDELLADVDLDRSVDDRDEEPKTRLADHRSRSSAPGGRRPSSRTAAPPGPTGTG